jgi:hypothetical protein
MALPPRSRFASGWRLMPRAIMPIGITTTDSTSHSAHSQRPAELIGMSGITRNPT